MIINLASIIVVLITTILILFSTNTFYKIKIPSRLKKYLLISVLSIILILIMFFISPKTYILTLFFSIICVWGFLFGFMTNRKYIYTSAIMLLAFIPFLILLKLDKIAEYVAILTYLLLVLGVLKDLVYDKIFKL